MNQLKNNIIDKINTLDDENLIEALDSILDRLNIPEAQKLKKGEKELIEMGLKDYKNGETINDAELRKNEGQWLRSYGISK